MRSSKSLHDTRTATDIEEATRGKVGRWKLSKALQTKADAQKISSWHRELNDILSMFDVCRTLPAATPDLLLVRYK